MLITSGSVTEEVKKEAQKHNIGVMDGEELVSWIYENINELSAETKKKLKISIGPIVSD